MTADFRTTRWSRVLAAGRPDEETRDALGWLFEAYRDPLYAYVRRRGLSPEDAGDLVQAYFLRMIDKRGFVGLDPSRGRFRSFLIASIKHFLSNHRAHERAEKRRAQDPAHTISLDGAEEIYRTVSTTDLNAEETYERQWAWTVFHRALEVLRTEFEEAGRGELFDRLKGSLVGDSAVPYADVALELGMTETGVKSAVHRMRKRLGQVLRAEVSQTVATPAETDEEIRHLLRSLG